MITQKKAAQCEGAAEGLNVLRDYTAAADEFEPIPAEAKLITHRDIARYVLTQGGDHADAG